MSEGLAVRPVITGTAQLRRASSSCHGAPLNPGAEPETYTCRECGEPCERVLGGPQEITFTSEGMS